MHNGKPIVVVDMDGVLVDNFSFEEAVTKYIIGKIATLKSVSTRKAKQFWTWSLRLERESVKWYDYDHHCQNLGMPPLAKEAHSNRLACLRVEPGANIIWNLLMKHNASVYVVSDSASWVMEMKLNQLGFDGCLGLFSSQDIGEAKNTRYFWEKLRSFFMPAIPHVIVDNEIANIFAAKAVIAEATCVFLNRIQHSKTLPADQRPLSLRQDIQQSEGVRILHNHSQLKTLLAEQIGSSSA